MNNNIFNKHFVFVDEEINSTVLENFASRCASIGNKVVYIDFKRDSEGALKSYAFISSRRNGDSEFINVSSLDDISKKTINNNFAFINVRDDKDCNIEDIIQTVGKKMHNAKILLNILDFNFNIENLKEISKKMYQHKNQLCICTDDTRAYSFFTKIPGIIFYKTSRTVDFI